MRHKNIIWKAALHRAKWKRERKTFFCRKSRWKERLLMTKTRQKRWENRQKISVGGWQEWKHCNVGYHLSRGNSSSHRLPLSVQNTLLQTYFPFHGALISLPRIHLVANTESDISRAQVCRPSRNTSYCSEWTVELWHFIYMQHI